MVSNLEVWLCRTQMVHNRYIEVYVATHLSHSFSKNNDNIFNYSDQVPMNRDWNSFERDSYLKERGLKIMHNDNSTKLQDWDNLNSDIDQDECGVVVRKVLVTVYDYSLESAKPMAFSSCCLRSPSIPSFK